MAIDSNNMIEMIGQLCMLQHKRFSPTGSPKFLLRRNFFYARDIIWNRLPHRNIQKVIANN